MHEIGIIDRELFLIKFYENTPRKPLKKYDIIELKEKKGLTTVQLVNI